MIITSVNNPLIKETTKLHQKKYRDELGLFLIEGYHLYEEAKKYANVKTIFTTDQTIIGEQVVYVSSIVLQKLAKTQTPQPILCVCEKLRNHTITNRVLILEQVQDPGNLGTLLRSALAFGFDTVVLDNTCDLYNEKVIRSTQGNFFSLHILEQNTLDFMMMNPDFYYIGTAMEGKPLKDINETPKIALILGNEGNGISNEVLRLTNINITIETNIESLNVAVAGGILMHHIHSQQMEE